MRWLKDVNDDIYDPLDTGDMLRVAFTSEIGCGKLHLLRLLWAAAKEYQAIAEQVQGSKMVFL